MHDSPEEFSDETPQNALTPAAWEMHGGQPCLVPVVPPAVYDDREPELEGAAEAAIDILRRCLDWVIGEGKGQHRDGARSRAVALALRLGLYSTLGEASKITGLSKSTLSDASKDMREHLNKLANTPDGSEEEHL